MKQVNWSSLSDDGKRSALQRPASKKNADIIAVVRSIIEGVRARGDEAVAEYTHKFDGVELDNFKASPDEFEKAKDTVSSEAVTAMQAAYENITAFHQGQGFKAYQTEVTQGVKCARIVRPIESVGLYVPGGSAPLVSTVLMTGVPSQIAGCSERVLCTPSDEEGAINPNILYAAKLCGITDVFKIGGAQAIAAMAYGTGSMPKTDKIFGPGNAYVTAAKRLVAEDADGAGMDMPAGPSEVCVIADETTNPVFAASDLLAQAEHDPLSQVVLIALSEEKIREIQCEVRAQIESLSRKEIAEVALQNSLAIIVDDMDTALEVSNLYAPEHLILCFEGAEPYVDPVQNAGSIFVGSYSTESAGDYCSGTNHALPTYGYARTYSGLGVEAFQKTITVQNLSKDGLSAFAPTIETLAGLEGLDAHAQAVSRRLES